MKKVFFIAATVLFFLSCKSKEETRTNYTINGSAKGVYNGVRAYLKTFDYKTNKGHITDTAIIFNEKFVFEGAVENPELKFLTINSVNGRLPFILENSNITIDVEKTNIITSKIEGSSIQKSYKAYYNATKEIQKTGATLLTNYKQARSKNDTILQDSLVKVLDKNKKEFEDYPLNYARNNNSDYLSLILLKLEVDKSKNSIEKFKLVFDDLDDDLKSSPAGLELGAKLNQLYQTYLKKSHLEIGKIAPNFSAPTPDGTMLSLDNIKGKVTIIDFWAAWCGPCRRENPNVVKVYNAYHDDGLEIIGVSLDGQRRQKDPKKAWLEAIEKDNLSWNHVSNLKYFSDPVAQLYQISSIPATYILDEDGKIVAKNLRGIALERKVKELLGK